MALIDVPEGAAMVFQPRGLVGVVFRAVTPPRITSHWRLASPHAWLTLQFRYLVFHGPVGLIARGCRGVRVERADGERSIRQDATLGFSAGLRYANGRSTPALSYLRGERALFVDRFAGEAGYFVYEEIPRKGRTAGIGGRGLEGFTDALLKAFGI